MIITAPYSGLKILGGLLKPNCQGFTKSQLPHISWLVLNGTKNLLRGYYTEPVWKRVSGGLGRGAIRRNGGGPAT